MVFGCVWILQEINKFRKSYKIKYLLMKFDLVSVIINCYNSEKFLKSTLDSLVLQTYKNWELIFYDNCSTDNSFKIFKNYKDKRFKYFKSKKV